MAKKASSLAVSVKGQRIPGWEHVERYLNKENEDSARWALLEADKIFLNIVSKKGYKTKDTEGKIALAVKEMETSESFARARGFILDLRDKINFEIGDIYSVEETINIYRQGIEDLIYGDISGDRVGSWKYRFWPVYYYFLLNRRKIVKIVLWTSAIIILMLFIADTSLGRSVFDYFIDKIHFVLRVILAVLLVVFALSFVVILSIVVLESKGRKKRKREN